VAYSSFVTNSLARRHRLDPGGCGEPDQAEPATDIRELLGRADWSDEETPDTIRQRGGLGDTIPNLRGRDVGAVGRIASCIHLAKGASEEDAGDGQSEHEPNRCQLTKSRVHGKVPNILRVFVLPVGDALAVAARCASVTASPSGGTS
jgi:hypothetical protein